MNLGGSSLPLPAHHLVTHGVIVGMTGSGKTGHQTDADRERVLDGIGVEDTGHSPADLAQTLKKLAPRWFVVRNAHARSGPVLVQPRTTYSLLRGPMTRAEIRAAIEWRASGRRSGA